MTDESPMKHAFNADHAAVYDDQFAPLRAIKDLLHLMLQIRFADLPEDARILMAGAGTGAEVRFLAPLFPGWRFTLADPAEAMLAVARRHAEAEGFAERCVFHCGTVSSLPGEAHDAATSLLVSHFLTDAGDRQSFFGDIATRLRPGGVLFNADLCTDPGSARFDDLMDFWIRMLAHTGALPDPSGADYRAAYGRLFAAHGPAEVEALIERAGFEPPTTCYQAALIRGWITTRR